MNEEQKKKGKQKSKNNRKNGIDVQKNTSCYYKEIQNRRQGWKI